MAFVKKTWTDRISEYPNRRTINDGYVTKTVTVGRDEGVVTEVGTPFNATEMNDLEDRIDAAISGGGGASALDDLTDVDITSATSGQVLKYDGSKWINGTGGGVPWVEITGTLLAGNVILLWTANPNIHANSTIDIYVDNAFYGVSPLTVALSEGSLTLTFEAQAADMPVKVRLS